MFAVIESGGKQLKVTEGDNLQVELLTGEEGSKVEFNKVLMISDGKKSKVGSPFLEKAKVIGLRAQQIASGSKPFIEVPRGMSSVVDIAEKELENRKIPFIVKRYIGNGQYEYWKLEDLKY